MSILQAGRPSKNIKETLLSDVTQNSKNIRVNFDLPENLHTALKLYALKEKKSIKEILTEEIKKIVNE